MSQKGKRDDSPGRVSIDRYVHLGNRDVVAQTLPPSIVTNMSPLVLSMFYYLRADDAHAGRIVSTIDISQNLFKEKPIQNVL